MVILIRAVRPRSSKKRDGEGPHHVTTESYVTKQLDDSVEYTEH